MINLHSVYRLGMPVVGQHTMIIYQRIPSLTHSVLNPRACTSIDIISVLSLHTSHMRLGARSCQCRLSGDYKGNYSVGTSTEVLVEDIRSCTSIRKIEDYKITGFCYFHPYRFLTIPGPGSNVSVQCSAFHRVKRDGTNKTSP